MSWPRVRSDGYPRTQFQQWLAIKKACELGRTRAGNLRPETIWKTWTNVSDLMWLLHRLPKHFDWDRHHTILERAVYCPELTDKHKCDVLRSVVPELPPFRNYDFQPWTPSQLEWFAQWTMPPSPPAPPLT